MVSEKKRKGGEEEEEIGANIDCGQVAAASGCEQYVVAGSVSGANTEGSRRRGWGSPEEGTP